MAIDIAIAALLLVVVLAMSIKATLFVLRDDLSEPVQRIAQLGLVWLLPILGAIIVFAVHRRTEPPSRKYREETDHGDYDLSPRAGNKGRSFDGADDD
ncbi:hypothetical protein D3870_02635 [Noviherbaspirillum cavernae]|uniref:Uncharacterized protein n=2 Tax=Noviherbaspirillum cavernae TaxID=2320862 RepID=A0A418WXV9_9BURK|nr:hypothetical protein D3870_02635 [Noviherbaspirillum cavernae]